MAGCIRFKQHFGQTSGDSSISFTVIGNGGSYLFFNANQQILATINVAIHAPDQNKINFAINGNSRNLSLSVSGQIVTITADTTMWGETIIMGNAITT